MAQYGGIIVLIVLFGLMYFFMIRPQKKQQQKHQETLKTLQKGDHVITIGRLHGVVDDIDRANNTVTLDCDGVYLEFDLNAIANVNKPTATNASSSSEAKETTKADDSKSDDNK
ncbi:preprotein translocase subunit YajC [Fructilactobacillus lindneri]|nr:preprotein translocase subunit YajC [Fructilactobacillus lindneri]ANZ58333.1 preprotein translocase subunit YajC [Fructilactobacillus lindneri]ANZ59655.1 preprotein translocase subunit YajC [Fructilactobacillus lindneri]POG98561.1 preprotein translocase subunit YajC [Fructilactobacillus lindneri]POH03949.1 preprotein translocase subunit YajC [Fructilactobacillus lindneri]POH04808.1 preprotein translocase subunit YajC [Fructilactobacillus lindneri]